MFYFWILFSSAFFDGCCWAIFVWKEIAKYDRAGDRTRERAKDRSQNEIRPTRLANRLKSTKWKKKCQGIAPTTNLEYWWRARFWQESWSHFLRNRTSIHEHRSKPIEKETNKKDLMELTLTHSLSALRSRIHLASLCSIIDDGDSSGSSSSIKHFTECGNTQQYYVQRLTNVSHRIALNARTICSYCILSVSAYNNVWIRMCIYIVCYVRSIRYVCICKRSKQALYKEMERSGLTGSYHYWHCQTFPI